MSRTDADSNPVACRIVRAERKRCSGGRARILAGVLDECDGGRAAWVHCDYVVFGVVSIAMDAIVEKVSGSVVGVAVHSVVVLRRARIVSREGGKEGLWAVLLPAIAEAVVDVRVDGSAAVLVGADQAIEGIIAIRPVSIGAVVGSQDVAIGGERSDIEGVDVCAVERGSVGLQPGQLGNVSIGFGFTVAARV